MAKTPTFRQTGVMADGRIVLSFFPLVDTYGLPVEMAVSQLVERGYMPDWLDFWLEASRCGWAASNTYTRLEAAVEDSFGPEFAEGWKITMKFAIAMLTDPVPSPLLLPTGEVVDRVTGQPAHPDIAAHMRLTASRTTHVPESAAQT